MDYYLTTAVAGQESYLGHLVVVAAAVSSFSEAALSKHLSKMSKRENLGTWSEDFFKIAPSEILCISPKSYNKFYARVQESDKIVEWALRKVTSPLLKAYDCHDKIACYERKHRKLLERGLLQDGRSLDEDFTAPASVLSATREVAEGKRRLLLLNLLENLGYTLPKNDEEVLRLSRHLYAKEGLVGLSRIAKIHFSQSKSIR